MDRKVINLHGQFPTLALFLFPWFWLPGCIWNRIKNTIRVRSKNFIVFKKDVADPGVQNILRWGSGLRFLFASIGRGSRGGSWAMKQKEVQRNVDL